MAGEQLVIVLRPESGQAVGERTAASLAECNRRLVNYKRISGYLIWDADFPRTASLKIKRAELAEQIRKLVGRDAVVPL
jgi:acyl-CoA synthetase (AMP-forming)/AMP-acid ligase II